MKSSTVYYTLLRLPWPPGMMKTAFLGGFLGGATATPGAENYGYEKTKWDKAHPAMTPDKVTVLGPTTQHPVPPRGIEPPKEYPGSFASGFPRSNWKDQNQATKSRLLSEQREDPGYFRSRITNPVYWQSLRPLRGSAPQKFTMPFSAQEQMMQRLWPRSLP